MALNARSKETSGCPAHRRARPRRSGEEAGAGTHFKLEKPALFQAPRPLLPLAALVPGPAWQGLADLLGSDLDLFPEPLPQLLRPVFPAQPRSISLSRGKKTP